MLAVPLISLVGAVALGTALAALPVMLGSVGLIGLGGLGASVCCWRCLRPYDECTCEGKCRNPSCRNENNDAFDAKNPVPPPKTGDSWTITWLAGAGLMMALGMLVMLKRKKKEA